MATATTAATPMTVSVTSSYTTSLILDVAAYPTFPTVTVTDSNGAVANRYTFTVIYTASQTVTEHPYRLLIKFKMTTAPSGTGSTNGTIKVSLKHPTTGAIFSEQSLPADFLTVQNNVRATAAPSGQAIATKLSSQQELIVPAFGMWSVTNASFAIPGADCYFIDGAQTADGNLWIAYRAMQPFTGVRTTAGGTGLSVLLNAEGNVSYTAPAMFVIYLPDES